MNFHDFAGSTVVHTIGGMVALAGALVLGPRIGRRFKRDGGGPMMPHDLTIAASGGLLLWFGWYGFNPGSTLSAMDFEGIGRVAANTTLAACAAGLTAMMAAYWMSKKWDVSFTVNGFLAGLVAITCPCYWVSPAGSIALGAVSPDSLLSVEWSFWSTCASTIRSAPFRSMGCAESGERCRWVCLLPVSTARPDRSLQTTPLRLTGLFYGGGTKVLTAQVVGSAIVTVATFAVATGRHVHRECDWHPSRLG